VSRSTVLPLIALGLAAYAVYTAVYLPSMLIGPPMPLLVVAFVLQVVCAVIASAGVWSRRSWAARAVGLLSASIVATQLIEVLLGILPYLRAVLVAVLAIIGALLFAMYADRAAHVS
jgi:hypothetical protein